MAIYVLTPTCNLPMICSTGKVLARFMPVVIHYPAILLPMAMQQLTVACWCYRFGHGCGWRKRAAPEEDPVMQKCSCSPL